MAENESLDLADSRRWESIYGCIRQGKSAREVADKVEQCLCRGLRRAFRDFVKEGVSLKDFLSARHNPDTLQQLLKKARGHDYARLFLETALTEKKARDDSLLENYVGAVWDKMSDQIAQNIVPCDRWPNFPDLGVHLDEVREHIAPRVHRIAAKLADDPTWPPMRQAAKGGTKEDETKSMLTESMLGVLRK